MRIAMLLSNGFAPDPRVAAEAVALNQAGHQVTIYVWDRLGQLPPVEDFQGVKVIRAHIPSGYSRGPLQIFNFFRFWKACAAFLATAEIEAIHCHDLDTLKAGIDFGKRRGLPVIYDAHESYPDMVAHLFPKPVVAMVRCLEKSLVPRATAVITVGQVLAEHFWELRAAQVTVVGNYKKLADAQPAPAPAAPPLKIIYVGGLNRDRLLAPLIAVLKGRADYQLRIVGSGPAEPELRKLADSASNIKFTGFLPQLEAQDLISRSHLLYYGIDGRYPNNHYSAPNSLFMAMAAGRPVICNNVGEIARIVQEEGCGAVLADLGAETILRTLPKYLQNGFWEAQSRAGFAAAERKYHWGQAAQELIALYQRVENSYART